MRRVIDQQIKFGEVVIENIEFDLTSRDEIPKLLIGLQEIYKNRALREEVFKALELLVPAGVSPDKGRRGMELWKILVLGTLRLNCNWDYDKVQEMANNHKTLRLMLGHSDLNWNDRYALQTIKDNISLFTLEVYDKINQLVVKYGHKMVGKGKDEGLIGSCDSFVVETDVAYPTDLNLLMKALTKVILLIMALCGQLGLGGWRKGEEHLRKALKAFNKVRRVNSRKPTSAKRKAEHQKVRKLCYSVFLEIASKLIDKAKTTMAEEVVLALPREGKVAEVWRFIEHAERQIDQIERRIFRDEKIPHEEKVFSIFEEHTEWISKGKAGVEVELGLKVSILKDQYGFILHHRVMVQETDDKVAVPMVKETKERFPELKGCSFDQGYHSPENQKILATLLEKVILPRKGRLSAEAAEIENGEEFKRLRRKHSAVEASISALENHGLDVCPDNGIQGFERYVALAVLARNIQIVGHIAQQKALKKQQRKDKLKLAA
jgi:hypothetical protein